MIGGTIFHMTHQDNDNERGGPPIILIIIIIIVTKYVKYMMGHVV